MKPLPLEFTKSGWTFKQLIRNGMVAMYERRKGKILSIEVVKIHQNKEWKIGDKTIPASESMPVDKTWGVAGFTFLASDMKNAELKYAEMVANQDADSCSEVPA